MPDRRINYQIGITADTSQLETSLKAALSSLNKLGSEAQITTELQQASTAAVDLGRKLQEAVNPKTGTLDLRTLNESLTRSGKTLEDYYNELISLGPAGQQAFSQVAQAITSAELPLKRSNKLLDSLWTTMKNTMRWQFTTSALRTFTGAIQTAYGYAKDLNESLNNIRIVTQKSTEDMAEFAQRANEAAKNLSTTTTNYTDASLIYYQQGLSDKEVEARTEATIKLANVAGISAKEASNQLTAIWNNFANGSKNLEHYVDVMVKLGAETASSSSEISEGLRKFSAVADTVGLSYEYAAAALATVTATTRESADVVGTSFRTLFARIQGLQQGETLDDGTDLNKYSEALAKVGIQIKDETGNLKDMNIILDELGARWQTLAKDQQVALAETVAGVRQYTQLVALMDNWSYFQENVVRAETSQGALNQQAAIYAESWKAARDRVRASAKGIYDAFINPDVFIELDNVLTPILDTVADIVDAFGGLTGILPIVANLMFSVYGDRIAESMRSIAASSGVVTATEAAKARALQAQAADLQKLSTFDIQENQAINLRNQMLQENLGLQGEIATYIDGLTESQQEQLKADYAHIQNLQAQLDKYSQIAAKAEETIVIQKEAIAGRVNVDGNFQRKLVKAAERVSNQTQREALIGTNKQGGILQEELGIGRTKKTGQLSKISVDTKTANQEYKSLVKITEEAARQQAALKKLSAEAKNLDNQAKPMTENMKKLAMSMDLMKPDDDAQQFFNDLLQGTGIVETTTTKLDALKQVFMTLAGGNQQARQSVEAWIQAVQESGIQSEAASQAYDIMKQRIQELHGNIENNIYATRDWAATFVSIGQTISQVGMVFNSLKSLVNVFDDDTMSGWDKFVTVLTNVGMLMPMIISLTKSLGLAQTAQIAIEEGEVVVKTQGILADAAKTVANKILATSEGEVAGAAAIATASFAAQLVVLLPYIAIFGALAAAIGVAVAAHNAHVKAIKANAEAAQKAADEAKEERQTNEDLIRSMNEALETYKETGENKAELNEATKNLADAYGLEGDSLAGLTGQYEDYNKVLQESIDKQKELYQQELEETERANRTLGLQIAQEAKKGKGHDAGGGLYEVNFGGYGNESDIANIVAQETQSFSFDKNDVTLYANLNDPESLIKLYDKVVKARDAVLRAVEEGAIKETDLLHSGVYDDMTEWIDKMSDSVQQYKANLEEIAILKSKLGELPGMTISDTEVKNLADYDKWVKQVSDGLEKLGYDKSDISNQIQQIVDNSLNPQLKGFKATADAIDTISKTSLLNKNQLSAIFEQDLDKNILMTLDWSKLTTNGWRAAYDAALRYKGVIEEISDIESRRESLLEIQDALSSGPLTEEDYEKVKELAESGILDFSTFLQSSYTEQKRIIDDLVSDSYYSAELDVIQQAESELASSQELLSQYTEDQINNSVILVDQFEKIKALIADVNEAKEKGEGFDFENMMENYGLDEDTLAPIFKKYLHSENVQGQLEAIARTGTDMDWLKMGFDEAYTIQSLQETRDEAQKQLDDEKNALEIKLRVQKDIDLDRIRNSVDKLVTVYDAIGSGVKQSTDELGQSYWSFSLEAAKAIESIYPGFMAQADVMRDGTFKLTDDMYQAFFNMENGILAANSDAMAEKLRTNIEDLKLQKANAETRLAMYQKVADGAKITADMEADYKKTALETYTDAQDIQNGKILENQADTLETEQDNWAQLWEDVGIYSSTGAENMAENVADGTESVLENLEAIRDAAYAAGRQVAGIGTDMAKQEISKKVVRFEPTRDNSIDTSNADAFYRSIQKKVEEENPTPPPKHTKDRYFVALDENGEETKHIPVLKGPTETQQQKIAKALAELEQNNIDAFNEMIAANEEAYSKLFTSLTSAYEGAGGNRSGDKDADTEEYLEKKVQDASDRYNEIDRTLQLISNDLDDINSESDRAFGTRRLDLYKSKLQTLEKEVTTYNGKLALAQHFLKEDRAELESLGLNLQFDENTGEILRYQDVLDNINKEYNAFADSYNEFIWAYNGMTSAQQEAAQEDLASWQKRKEEADQDYEARLAALQQYQETLDVIQQIRDAWEDAQREIEDTKLQEVTYKMEVILEIKNAEDAIRDFDKQVSESFSDALYNQLYGKVFENGEYTTSRNNGSMQKGYEQALADAALLEHMQEEYAGLVERLQEANQFTNMDELAQDFLDLSQNAIDSSSALLEWIETIQEMLPNALAAARERFDEFTNQIEHNTSILEAINELYELQGVTYKTAEGFNTLQANVAARLEAAVDLSRANKEWNARTATELAQAEAALNDLYAEYGGDIVAAEGDIRFDTLKANYDALLEEFQTSEEAMYESATQAMQLARDMYLQQVEKAVYDFGNAVSGDLGLDFLQEKYDHYIKENERYLDSVNEAYEVATWYNKLQAEIDKTTDVNYARQLQDLQKEIDLRREGGKLSQYDLDILEAKYKVAQAQAALDDAQNAKTNLRLVRDSQGNWNYQYTADPDQIAQKQQELLDAENGWYNIAKQQVEDVTGEIISTWQECQDEIEEVYNDMTLTDEERSARAQEIYDYYCKAIEDLEREKGVALQDIAEGANHQLESAAEATGEYMVDIADTFDTTWMDTLDSMTANTGTFKDALTEAMENCNSALGGYEAKIDEIAELTGTDLDSLKTKTDDITTANSNLYDTITERMPIWFDLIGNVHDASDEYIGLADSIWKTINAMRELAAESAKQAQEISESTETNTVEMPEEVIPPETGTGDTGTGSSGSGGTGASAPISSPENVSGEIKAWAFSGGNRASKWYNSPAWVEKMAQAAGADKIDAIVAYAKTQEYADNVGNSGWANVLVKAGLKRYYTWADLIRDYPKGFASGGYTGEFDGARLAFLHEKELVLNKTDTQNILTAVAALRLLGPELLGSIQAALDSSAAASIASMGQRLSYPSIDSSLGTVEQEVHIEASFPNVTSHTEIEDAFTTLINDAAQWARRRTQ